MLLKILALGFVMHRDSYLRSPWNIMDFVVVTSALAEKSVLVTILTCTAFFNSSSVVLLLRYIAVFPLYFLPPSFQTISLSSSLLMLLLFFRNVSQSG